MLKNANIICISSIDWDFIWQGHQEIMSAFAKNGNRVLFIENTGVRAPRFGDIGRLQKRVINWLQGVKGFKKETDNLFIYSPLILPFPYSRIARWINKHFLLGPLKRWMKAMTFYDPIIWTFLPTGTAMDIINGIDKRFLVYYCIADFYKLVGNPAKIKKTEDELIRKSDLIFAQGNVLKEKCEKINQNVHIFPFGVNIETFQNFHHSPDKIPADIKHLKKPIIGYVGGVHRHIDFELIKFIAKTNPEKSIVLIGPIQTDVSKICNLKNVFLLKKKDFNLLPNFISEFDVCIIPYELNEYTKTVFPTKLNEYHALGKPIVSTDIPEVVKFNRENNNLVFIGKTKEQFNRLLSEAMQSNTSEVSQKRVETAKLNDWSSRISNMSDLIEKQLLFKEKEATMNWKNNFLKLYQWSKKKLIFTIATLAIVYFILFYTPFMWFVASPLKLSSTLRKADAIVVFAGGVGESGKAGQGYEERVGYAVRLYREGYARHLIFSSGYRHVFREPQVMKALAVSLGVPKENIILEDSAKSTEENVMFTKVILENENWNKVLLVSSPYHMRRVSLVFKKGASNIIVFYAPIENSPFYARPKIDKDGKGVWRRINARQIKAIMHEYLAIVYYWFKGYI